MNLVHDYVHPTPAGGQCRIRLYLPEEEKDSPVVICTEPTEGNEGMSITNCAEVVAAKVIEANRLEAAPVWIEHYENGVRGTEEDPDSARGGSFDLVTFSSYVPMEFVSVAGWDRRLGRPSWKALDRQTVERLIGAEL